MPENERSGPVAIRAAAYNLYVLHPRVADLALDERDVWLAGYGAALTDLAERADALDDTWRPPTRRTPAEVRRDRLASLVPEEGIEEWGEAMRQQTLRHMGFVCSPDRMTPALEAAGIQVSPMAACDWPPVAGATQ